MRPTDLKTKIFADTGNPEEAKELIKLLGFLDGLTTNPSLIAKNPEAKERIEKGGKFTLEEINNFYKEVVTEVSHLIPTGSVSIEVYADESTKVAEMLAQAKEFYTWIPNAHIKIPIIPEGLKAAEAAVKEGLRLNMTLCFSQEQAAAVYAATRGAKKGDIFISPFVGRLDDQNENGMDLIANIIKMYKKGDGHVEVLTASVRNYDHHLYALQLGSDIITAPTKILKEWAEKNLVLPADDYNYNPGGLKEIGYKEFDLNKNYKEFNIYHELTDKGLKNFANDWNSLINS